METKNLHFETLQLHVGQEQHDTTTGSRAVPIYQTTSYVFDNSEQAANRFALQEPGNIYGRLTNSTQAVLESRIAALENGAAAVAVASGAAAVTYALLNIAQAGDHFVVANNIYGGSYNLLAHTLAPYGISATFVDPKNPDNFNSAIQPNTKAIFIETISNPNAEIVDIDTIATIAHQHNIPLIVDNTLATPYLIRPIEHGADIVVHSATKFIGGHGTTLGGIIVDSGKFNWLATNKFPQLTTPSPSYHNTSFTNIASNLAYIVRIRAIWLRDTGATLSPFNAFLLLQGTETLSLRIERHIFNTQKVVQFLQSHPKVLKVNHPAVLTHPSHQLYNSLFPNGAAPIFTFDIIGDKKTAFKFIDNLQIFSLLANIADSKSLVIHPATTTHSQLSPNELQQIGITPSTIRLSIGTEHINDIIADLNQALNKI